MILREDDCNLRHKIEKREKKCLKIFGVTVFFNLK